MRISGSNAGYTMFRGSVKSIGYPLHPPVSTSLPLPCVTVCHHISTGVNFVKFSKTRFTTLGARRMVSVIFPFSFAVCCPNNHVQIRFSRYAILLPIAQLTASCACRLHVYITVLLFVCLISYSGRLHPL